MTKDELFESQDKELRNWAYRIWLQGLRKTGISMTMLAEQLGISRSKIENIVHGYMRGTNKGKLYYCDALTIIRMCAQLRLETHVTKKMVRIYCPRDALLEYSLERLSSIDAMDAYDIYALGQDLGIN